MLQYIPILTKFEVKYPNQKHGFFITTEYDDLKKYLNIPMDKEGFETQYLAVGEVIEILPSPDWGTGKFKITEIRTFIENNPESGKSNSDVYKWGFHVIYFVEDVK
jgi:hypothetical protein